MRERISVSKSIRPAVAIFVASLLPLACSGASTDDDVSGDAPADTASTDDEPADDLAAGDGPADTTDDASDVGLITATGHAGAVAALTELLPADTRGAFVFDVETLLSGGSSAEFTALLNGEGVDPALGEWFGAVGALAGSVDVGSAMTSALLAQTTDATDGLVLLAGLGSETIEEVVAGPMPTPDGTYGSPSRAVYVDGNGNHLTLLPGGVLVVGTRAAVESVIDVADGANPGDASAIVPFLGALSGETEISFVYGLPALFADVTPDLSLRGAAVLSGALDVVDGDIGGAMAFHTANAAEFVETYNSLDRHATQSEDPSETPLTLAAPVAAGLSQVIVTIPAGPIDPSPAEAVASRNIFKKLFVGMEAYDYAAGVFDPGNAAWADLIVKSEADGDQPPSPASVFFRWEFRDQAAIDAFEANELPAGFRLAPTRFFESDPAEGEYFLLLNLYNAGGGSIVGGARAEWDVYVHGPDGADPNAGERPRFFVVEALAEEVSADPVNLVTTAEPVSHARDGDEVVSTVRRIEGDETVPVFASTFPVPDPDEAEMVRFTPEMAIGNDYIYWGYGVSDRVLYNATTFNHDAYLVDPADVTITDDSRWAQYLKPDLTDVVYYVNTLEYVASPLANLDSDYLDITPEWLAELYGFKNNGHQSGIMRKSVEQLFRGENDALVGFHVGNETPSTYYHFEITDPDALSAALDLPPGHRLAPTTLFEGGDDGHYLTLSVYEIDDAIEGTRAEWSVYTDDGDGRPPNMMVLDLMTEEVGIDPVSIINLPSDVRHDLADGVLSTRLSSSQIRFEASFETAGAAGEALSLDWVEAGDVVCYLNGICDKLYYDAETLDVPVRRPLAVTVDTFSTPWNDFVTDTPVVFYRDNAQEYVAKRWYNLDVFVDELPFSGLEGRTHVISGSGTLVGRDSDVADSIYSYSGDAELDGDQLTFAIDQQIDNVLGVGNIFTTGSFDLTTGTGTQTVVDCLGPALLCSDIVIGSTAFYTVQALDASDPEAIDWRVDVVLDLGGTFGTADSASTFTATRVD
jgi:hypothetical protein